MKFHHYLLLIALVALVLAGCRTGEESLAPPEIRYGEDVCDHCNMLISEPRFAAAYAAENGDTRRFDDVGEMLLYAHERGESVRAFWVHDFHSEAWIQASAAAFVHNPDLVTPMGWGIAAFDDHAAAQAYGDEHGAAVLTFAQLQMEVQHGDLAPQGMARHDH